MCTILKGPVGESETADSRACRPVGWTWPLARVRGSLPGAAAPRWLAPPLPRTGAKGALRGRGRRRRRAGERAKEEEEGRACIGQ